MDQYSFLKLINCIRKEKLTADKIKTASEEFWKDEKYLKPLEYEPWLSYGINKIYSLVLSWLIYKKFQIMMSCHWKMLEMEP